MVDDAAAGSPLVEEFRRTTGDTRPVEDASIDFCVSDFVLEHVHEPDELMAVVAAALAPGGTAIFIVPNYHDVRRFYRKWRLRHHFQPKAHVNYFTSGSLRSLYQRHGFQPRSFDIAALRLPADALLAPGIVLNRLGVYPLGLYTYGVKRRA